MNKKVWWVGIVIIITIFLTNYASAYTIQQIGSSSGLTFTNAGGFTGGTFDCTKPSFEILATSGTISDTLTAATAVSACDGTKSSPVDSNGAPISMPVLKKDNGNICIGYTNIDLAASNKAYVILGGYMYLNNPLSSFYLSSKWSFTVANCGPLAWNCNTHSGHIYTYFSMYTLNNGYNLGSEIKLTEPSEDYNYSYSPGGYDNRNSGHHGMPYCYDSVTNTHINPGVYYVFYILNLNGQDNAAHYTDNINAFISLTPPGDYSGQNTNLISTSNYIIYPKPLTQAQVLANYDDNTIDIAFCNAAGGDSNASIPVNHGCCRAKYEGVTFGNWTCTTDDVWQQSDVQQYCDALGSASGNNANFSQGVLNIYQGNNDAFQFIKNTFGGSDGCCGDDVSTQGTCLGSINCAGLSGTDSKCIISNGCTQSSCNTYSGCSGTNCANTIASCISKIGCTDIELGYCSITIPPNTAGASIYQKYICRAYGGTWYTTYVTCNNSFCQGSGSSCNYLSDPTECSATFGCTYNITAGSGDVGFISSTGSSDNSRSQYLCLNSSTLQNPKDSNYKWFRAEQNPYLITTLATGSKTTDVISNGNDWYYCNATGDVTLGGKPVAEYHTFNNKNSDNTFSCSELLALATGDKYTDCPVAVGGPYKLCCKSGPPVSPLTFTTNCDILCYGAEGAKITDICASYPTLCSSGQTNSGSVPPPTSILKDSCPDASMCLTGLPSNSNLTCAAQPFNTSRVICSNNQACIDGINITTSIPSENCCVGDNAYCANISSISNNTACQDNNGTPYSTNYYACNGYHITIDSDYSCCFSSSLSLNLNSQQMFETSNSSFMCFKENGNNLFADCCYDKSCSNSNLFLSDDVYDANSRVQSLGSALHTIQNFDIVEGGAIKDYFMKYSFTTSSHSVVITRSDNNYSFYLPSFEFIEFDIAYTIPVAVQLNSGNTVPVSIYSTNGNKPNKWHHIVIPISEFNLGADNIFSSMTLTMNGLGVSQPGSVLIDNIILTPPKNSSINSQNFFCTGGFQGWISDFDPPTGTDLSNWMSYGPYMLACNSQAAYGWTGSRCCGDDSGRNNYGEFYADTPSACFNGTLVKDGWSLGYANNYYESSVIEEDQLSTYVYSGILYYNNSFVGCQIPNHDAGLNVSTDGTLVEGKKLVNSFVDSQCEMRGDYYCMNGIWRSLVLDGSQTGLTATGKDLELKISPAGPNLIKNDFVLGTGWSLLDNNVLHASSGGVTLVSNYTLDIKANVSYILYYNIQNNVPSCKIYFDFNGGYCTGADDFTQKVCFNDSWQLNQDSSQSIISVLANPLATNWLYFKDVKFRLRTGVGCTDVVIANISLIESTYSTDQVSYNYSALPSSGTIQSTGCCPTNYCWDGKTCVSSSLWMNNASYQGIWNTILTNNWTHNHVDVSNQSEAIGYRCVIINATSNEAQWIPSRIKYDWNYEKSGYCNLATDCFADDAIISQSDNTHSRGCIHNGEFVSDAPYTLGQGNHYCYNGNWTTRSYIVATLLQNISEHYNYVLHCYDDTSLTYNLKDNIPLDNVLSACVLIMKKTDTNQQIITGVVLDDANAQDFLTLLLSNYKAMYGVDTVSVDDCLTDTTLHISGTNFTKCIDVSQKLQVYYETNNKYFIVSNDVVAGIEQETIWNKISDFFKYLFRSPIISVPFNSINYTTNYDRIYVLRNQTLNVTAIEEAKYDENDKAIATILYVRYSGSTISNNPLYLNSIFKNVNDSMTAAGKTNIPVSVNILNNVDQELIIKSQDRSGLWPYFTSILRVTRCSGSDTMPCTNEVANAAYAVKTMTCNNDAWGAPYGACIVVSCNSGYIISDDYLSCISNTDLPPTPSAPGTTTTSTDLPPTPSAPGTTDASSPSGPPPPPSNP